MVENKEVDMSPKSRLLLRQDTPSVDATASFATFSNSVKQNSGEQSAAGSQIITTGTTNTAASSITVSPALSASSSTAQQLQQSGQDSGSMQSALTSQTLTKLIKNGVVVDEDDPILDQQSQIQMRESNNGQYIETLGN